MARYSQAEMGLESVSCYADRLRCAAEEAQRCQRAGDRRGLADARLGMGRAKEKLGDFAAAVDLAYEARALFQDLDDMGGVALCCHTMAVWAFHHGSDDNSLVEFQMAAEVRERDGEILLAAQSWHNLGYAQCRLGMPDEAFFSYRNSRILLDRVRAEQHGDLAAKACRELAFILSHLAFAKARYCSRDSAMAAAVKYFEHVARTGVHREPLLAYLALPIAIAPGGESSAAEPVTGGDARRLQEMTGLRLQPEEWFRHAVDEGRRAMVSYQAGQGRRPYLGARLLALAEYGNWLLRSKQADRGRALLTEAVALARARGWDGEARRHSAPLTMSRHCDAGTAETRRDAAGTVAEAPQ
jgi:tetratricopeptide (TPR) repeat protein